jgi:hypothetical protein
MEVAAVDRTTSGVQRWNHGPDAMQLLWLRIGEGTQEYAVDDREYGDGGTDAERERHNRDDRDARRSAKGAYRVPDIANGIRDPRQAALVAKSVHCLAQTAGL